MPNSIDDLLKAGPLKSPTMTEAEGRNPYLDLMLKTPVLSENTKGEDRSLSDRFWLNAEAINRWTLLGSGEAALYSKDGSEVDLSNPGDVSDYLRGEQIREREEAWNAMRPSRNPLEYAVAISGGIAGGIFGAAPELAIGLPSKAITAGATALSRVFRAGALGTGINTAIDPVVQALRIKAGLQEQYSPAQTAFAALLGFGVPGLIQGGIEVAGAAATRAAREAMRRGAPVPEPPTAIPPTQVPGEFGPVLRGEAKAPAAAPEAPTAAAPRAAAPPAKAPAEAPVAPPEPPEFAPDVVSAAPVAPKVPESPVLAEPPLVQAPGEPLPDFRADIPATPDTRAGVFLFDPRELQVDAETFQFKAGADAEGVTPILKGVSKWDADAAGQLVVWQRNDGTLFVADGHQRVALAKRLLNSGAEDQIRIPASLYREADGFAADDVKIIAAMKNIREGSGSIMDAAKILRLRPDMIDQIAEIGRTQTRQGVALAKLSDDVFRMAVNDVIDPRDAAVIGRTIPGEDPELQMAAAKIMVRLKPSSEAEAEILARRVREADLVASERGQQGDLLGDLDGPDTTIAEEVSIVARTIRTLAKDKNILKRVAVNASRIEEVGSTIARQQTLSAADESAALGQIVEKVAFTRGEVRDALLDLAKDVKDGTRSVNDAVEALIVALRRAERPGAARGGEAGGGGPPDAAVREGAADIFGIDRTIAEEVPSPQDLEPIKFGAGARLQSQTGRELAPAPKMDFGTDRKAANTLRRIDAWLLSEAVAEAESTSNDFVLTQMRGLAGVSKQRAPITEADKVLLKKWSDKTAKLRFDFGEVGAIVERSGDIIRTETIFYRGVPAEMPLHVKGRRFLSVGDEETGKAFAMMMNDRLVEDDLPIPVAKIVVEPGSRKLDISPYAAIPKEGENLLGGGTLRKTDDAPIIKKEGAFTFRFDTYRYSPDISLTPADRDLVNDFLFGSTGGATRAHLIEGGSVLPPERIAAMMPAEIKPPGTETFEQLIARIEADNARLQAEIEADIAAKGGYVTRKDRRTVIVTRSTSEPGMFQITNFLDGEPTGHINSRPEKLASETQGMTGPGFERVAPKMPPSTEPGAEGRPQLVLPGAEQITQAELAQRRAAQPLRPRVAQRDAGPLFDDGSRQMDLVEMAKAAGQKTDFPSRLAETRFVSNPAVKGPDGFAYRIKKDGDGYIGMRMPTEPGEPSQYLRPAAGETWTAEQAADRIVAEATPVVPVPEDVIPKNDLFAMMPADEKSLIDLINSKATRAEIEAHSAVQDAFRDQLSRPLTDQQPGYGTPEFWANRQYVFDGKPVVGREAIINDLVDKAKSYAPDGKPANEHIATIVLGPPASGKSRLSEKIARLSRSAIVDPDDAKMAIPEYDGGLGAHAVHEESADLTFGHTPTNSGGVIDHLVNNGTNVVIPKVGANPGSIRKLVNVLSEDGYKVRLVSLKVDPDEAYRRMIRRFVKTGRLISSDYFDGVDGKPSKTYYLIKKEHSLAEAIEIDGNARPGAQAVLDGAETELGKALRPQDLQPGRGGGQGVGGVLQTSAGPQARFQQPAVEDVHAFVGQLRGKPFRGETGRPTRGVTAPTAHTGQVERLASISDRVGKALGLTVRQGRITKPRALGTHNERTGVVRLKELDAFDVLVHEGGHGLHLLPANKPSVDGLIATHAVEVDRLAYPGTPAGQESVEGFAEWFRLWMTNPNYAAREAPNFTQEMEGWLRANRPTMLDDLKSAQTAYQDWLRAPSRDVVTGDLVSSGAPPMITRVGKAIESDRLPTGQSLMSWFDRFYTWTLDRLHPLNRGVRVLLDLNTLNTGQRLELPAASNPYILARLATNAHQAGHMDLMYGVVPHRQLDPVGPALAEALELAIGRNWFGNWRSDQMLDFGGYLVARRSIFEFERFLAGEVPNPPGKLTLGDYQRAKADYEVANPNFARAAEMVYEWRANLLRKKFDAGLISKTYFDKSSSKTDAVPFQRDFSEKAESLIRATGVKGTNRQSVMKTYRGSLRSIINPIESMISEAYSTAAIIARNDVISALADLSARAGPGGGAIAERIPASQLKPIRVDVMEALKAAGKDAGLNKADLDDLILAASDRLDSENVIATLFRAGEAPEKGEPIVYFWRGGERHALRLADRRFGKELYEAMTGLGQEQSNWIIETLAVPARGLRFGITSHPAFLLANYTRDQVAAFVLNQRFIPFVSGARGVVDELAQTRAARLYSQAGGIMGGANVASLNQARIGRDINALQKRGYAVTRFKDIREVIKLTEVSETGTRISLFKQHFKTAQANGLSEYEALVEAAFQARDFMDFGRHGSKMLFARKVVTFLNAALQGADKTARTLVGDLVPLARVFRGQNLTAIERAHVARSASAWLKVAGITALAATYALINRDEPEFQDASEYLRATHWMFKLPGGQWAMVPKPYEMSTIFNFGERMAEGIAGEDPTWAEKWLRSWAYTLSIPIEPVGLMTPAELYFNYDTFRDKPIVPQWNLGLEPWQQFDTYTSEFSKALGKAINVSPAKIDHLLVGWSGSWGRDLLNLSNMSDPQRRSEALYDWPITGRFIKNLARGSDATDKFYGLVSETGGRLERKNNAYNEMIKRGQDSQAEHYYGTLTDDEKVWVALNSVESADEKRVHPLRRASDILRVYSGIRRDVANRNVIEVITGRKIEVNPTIAWEINDQLARAAAAETRNAMIVVGQPGWASREVIDVQPYLSAIEMISPEIYREINDRLDKQHVLPFDGVRSVWPEVRDRLLAEGPGSYLGDLRAAAMMGGAGRKPSSTLPVFRPQ